jgi:tRNA A-37 threonylcarbamoyl transferase component Bud32
VRYRDLVRNAWHGFGWCATAVREGAILQAAQRAGVGCPEVVALGEAGTEAFVLTSDESNKSELRTYLTTHEVFDTRIRLAESIGRELAKMHDAGFDHPDLFAKHLLVSDDQRICILDWQRARWRKSVPWRLRMRDLALLDATLHDALASDRLRLRCLRAYLRATTQGDAPPLARMARGVRAESARLRGEQSIREIGQLPINDRAQQFVPLQEGRLLVVRSYYEERRGCLSEGFAQLLETNGVGRDLVAVKSFAGCTRVDSYVAKNREMPELAHTLFRLQRFGVAAPQLIAVGWSAAQVHLVTRAEASVPFDEACAKASPQQRGQWLLQAGDLVRRIHEAGYSLPFEENWSPRLGVTLATGEVVLYRVEPLERRSTPWQEFAPSELNYQKIRLSRTDRLRFLSGYLGQPRGRRQAPALLSARALLRFGMRERQAIG